MSDIAIRVEGLGKRYRIGRRTAPYRSLRESLTNAATAPWRRLRDGFHGTRRAGGEDTIWALKDVSLEVRRGEVVGVIGRNGAGKSTLLKVLSRITEPTEGRVELTGRVGSLLEVGTGFHLELTGRENIFLNGAILGMRRAEIQRKFDEIVAFAEIDKFLDTPVKHYSSGMYVRLAFAVAAHLEPEILLVDEVLAVGDAAFQKKCLGKIGEVARGGRTVLFVSHQLESVARLCDRAALVGGGQLVLVAETHETIATYLEKEERLKETPLRDRLDRSGNGAARICEFLLLNAEGNRVESVLPGEVFSCELVVEASAPASGLAVAIDLETKDKMRLASLNSRVSGDTLSLRAGRTTLRCTITGLNLRPDQYTTNLWLGTETGETFDLVEAAAEIAVDPFDYYGSGRLPSRRQGPLLFGYSWTRESTRTPDRGHR